MPNNGKPPRHTDRVRELAKYIADQPDEISEVTEQHIHLHGAASLEADRTGRMRAVSNPDLEITRVDNPKPIEPETIERGASAVARLIGAVDTVPKLLALLALVGLAAFAAWLRWG